MTETTAPPELSLAEQVNAARAALANANERADEAERNRLELEARHAENTAEAMLTGKPLPAKTKALSDAQATDDATDAAVEIIRKRVEAMARALKLVQMAEARDAAAKLLRVRVDRFRAGIARLREGFELLTAAEPIDTVRDVIVPRLLAGQIAGASVNRNAELDAWFQSYNAIRAPHGGDVDEAPARITDRVLAEIEKEHA